MIDLKHCRSRIEELEFFLSVKDSISAAEAMESFNAIPPAAFISTAGERAEPNNLTTGRRRQRVWQTVSILYCLGLERADDDNSDAAEEARSKVMAQAVGWRPDGADSPFDYQSYSIVQMGQGLMWAEVLVRAPWHLITAS